ncbi:hypothetical protein FCM35_KLT02538 [Carex littledalei]|uniref:Uncharacterized protein n=1 Tax=Carex littledalei TaxID=544730 RepID=A0A833RB19_9POAL|nr:hypothetical protein FCM35_KLT02538 [Carex littledalei]
MKRGGIKKMLAESEFKAAHEAAIEIGAKVVPGDRPHRITLDRLWARMTIMEKVFLACGFLFKILFFQSREQENEYRGIDDEDIELLNAFPPAFETLLKERHMYMAYNLWEEAGKCSSLVAVLERTHLDGIREYWSTSYLVDMVALSEVPTVKEQTSTVKFFASVGVVIVTLISIYLWRKN